MSFTEIKGARTHDSYFKAVHPTGLTIYVYPKEGYGSTYAMFGTKYGSVNRTFSVNGGEKLTVPDGIAHYLEHKLFESEDGDAFTRYAKTGASATPTRPLTRRVTSFPVRRTLKLLLKSCLILYSRRTLRSRQCRRSRALSGRKSGCMMIHQNGASCSTSWRRCTTAIL